MADPFLINYIVILTALLVISILGSTLGRQIKSLAYFPLKENAAWETQIWFGQSLFIIRRVLSIEINL